MNLSYISLLLNQLQLERSRHAEQERLFLVYAKQWWKEYLTIRDIHRERLVKIFAQVKYLTEENIILALLQFFYMASNNDSFKMKITNVPLLYKNNLDYVQTYIHSIGMFGIFQHKVIMVLIIGSMLKRLQKSQCTRCTEFRPP